ncbi:MAG TPA: amidohydrolase family protein, partial [Phycicoccus sp.]|nr:amidohydrolase family protein [Phycicoccus sp.]
MGHSPGHGSTPAGDRTGEPSRSGRHPAYRIERLRHVVTVDENFTILDDTTIEIADGVITAITPRATRAGKSRRPAPSGEHQRSGAAPAQEAEHEPEVTVIDGRRMLALPGLVNLHTHLPMTLLRGLAENVDLQGFLRIVWAAEGAVMDSTTVHLGAELGALESLLAGVTTTLDMYFHHEEAHLGAASTGLRHVGGPVFFDGPGPDGLTWAQRLDILESWPERLQDLDRLDALWRPYAVPDLPAPTVPAALMPHSTYTNSPAHLRDLAAALTSWPAGIPALIHVHVSENAAENTDVTTR